MRTLGLVVTAALSVSSTLGQPTSCTEDAQCDANFYCETALHLCQKCFHCEELKREAPALAASCIKSVVQCGPCLPGLTRDHRGDVIECSLPDESEAEPSLPGYIWPIIGFILLAVVLASAMLIYVFRKRDLFRISTRTWLGSGCEAGAGAGAVRTGAASAPDPPPPYNGREYMRTESPTDDDMSRPIMKPSTAPATAPSPEPDAYQNARWYDPPVYVRVPPESPFSPSDEDSESNNWPAIGNEDTTPDQWTPNDIRNNNTASAEESSTAASEEAGAASLPEPSPADLPALLAAARDTTLVAPPAKRIKSEDNNNNAEGSGGGQGDASRLASDGSSITVVSVVSVQINNTKL